MKTRHSPTDEVAQKTKTFLTNQVADLVTSASPLQEPAAESHDLRDQVAARAYALYEARGYRHGGDLQDWLDAEQEISSRQQPA